MLCRTTTILARSQPLWAAWNVTQQKYNDAVAQAAKLGFAGDKRIEFLCDKDVENYFDPQFVPASRRFKLIINPPKNNKEWQQRQDALHGILGMRTHNKTSSRDQETIPVDISFDAFCKKHPEWADRSHSTFVFFRDHHFKFHHLAQHPEKINVLIQRAQHFGTCSLHAPVVMQHYLVAMETRESPPTVDIPKWLRRHAPTEVLSGVIFGNGANAEQILEHLLPPNTDIRTATSVADMPSLLRAHGPILLPKWGVTRDFEDTNKRSHIGKSNEEVIAHHAMIVVGCRFAFETGGYRLLLQNWWRNKQFVEVDEAYYDSCMNARALCVATSQTHFRWYLDKTTAPFSVTAVDGSGVAGAGIGPDGR